MAKPILYGPDGQPINRAALTQEIAGATITGVRSPIAGYPGDGLNPRRLASLLREADQGEPLRYFELAEQIEERDLHYAGVLGTRKRQVAQLEITVEAASDDPAHVRHADTIRDWLARDELQDEIFDMLDAIGKGVSYTEIVWDSSEGQWRPQRLAWRDPRWFRPDRTDLRTPRLRTETGDVPLPALKFICVVLRAKSGLPVRSGLARLATWSWMFKAYTQRDWAIFAQTFGQPIRIGKYGPGATEEDKETLFRAVANIAGDCAAIVPDSMLIEFVESKNVGAGHQLYRERADWLDRQVSKAVLGQTGTTDATPGKLGGSDDHTQVREDIERADAKSLAAALNRDLVRPWIDLEFGPQPKYPRLRIGRPEDVNVERVLKGIEALVPLGLRVERSWAADLLGIPDPDEGAELLSPAEPIGGSRSALGAPPVSRAGRTVLGPMTGYETPSKTGLRAGLGSRSGPAAQVGDPAAVLAAVMPAPDDPLGDLIGQAEDVVQPSADALIDAVRRLVDRAGSLEDVRDGLLALKPQMPEEQLAGLMRLALVVAELSGQADEAESGGG